MEFYVLTILTVISLIYCCDYPVIQGFEVFINDKDSSLYAIALSIIASYIFYFIQVYVPKKRAEKLAYAILRKKIERYIENLYWILVFCESLCEIDRDNHTIKAISTYATWKKNDEEVSPWIVKIDVDEYYASIGKLKKAIGESGYYMQLEEKKRKAVQDLMDNNFVREFKYHLEIEGKMNSNVLIKEYDAFRLVVSNARKQFRIKDKLVLSKYEDKTRIAEFESKIQYVKSISKERNGIIFMRVK